MPKAPETPRDEPVQPTKGLPPEDSEMIDGQADIGNSQGEAEMDNADEELEGTEDDRHGYYLDSQDFWKEVDDADEVMPAEDDLMVSTVSQSGRSGRGTDREGDRHIRQRASDPRTFDLKADPAPEPKEGKACENSNHHEMVAMMDVLQCLGVDAKKAKSL